jgi:hypothetical protein
MGRTIAEFVAMLLAHLGLAIPELTIVPPGPMTSGDGLGDLLQDAEGQQ